MHSVENQGCCIMFCKPLSKYLLLLNLEPNGPIIESTHEHGKGKCERSNNVSWKCSVRGNIRRNFCRTSALWNRFEVHELLDCVLARLAHVRQQTVLPNIFSIATSSHCKGWFLNVRAMSLSMGKPDTSHSVLMLRCNSLAMCVLRFGCAENYVSETILNYVSPDVGVRRHTDPSLNLVVYIFWCAKKMHWRPAQKSKTIAT